MGGLCDEVRAGCAAIAARARAVTIDRDAIERLQPAPAPALDREGHYVDGAPGDVATYFLCLSAINFGSGWSATLRKRPGASGYETIAAALAERFRATGPWTPAQLRAVRADALADALGQARDHELMALYAQALRALGAFLGARTALDAIHDAGGRAEALAAQLAGGMALFCDRGFYKRAQIAAADLQLAGVARFRDLRRLTIFADNVVPHVLRCDGVLRYDAELAAHVDAERLLPAGPWEREIRACAVHACVLLAQRLGAAEHELDRALWHRGRAPEYKARPRHRTRTVYY